MLAVLQAVLAVLQAVLQAVLAVLAVLQALSGHEPEGPKMSIILNFLKKGAA